MTNELEKQSLVSSDKRARISGADDSSSLLEIRFFETFGIEAKCNACLEPGQICKGKGFNCHRGCKDYNYPLLTDSIYLELYCLICIAQNSLNLNIQIFELNMENLKETILERLIWIQQTYKTDFIKKQTQALFKEG